MAKQQRNKTWEIRKKLIEKRKLNDLKFITYREGVEKEKLEKHFYPFC